MAETMDTLLAGYEAASEADKPGWLERMNERAMAIQLDASVAHLPRRLWMDGDVVMVREPDGTIHPAAPDDPVMEALAARALQVFADPNTTDLGTFIGVINAFEDAGIEVRDSYWDHDPRPFVIMVDGAERRVASVELVDDRIVVTVQ